MGVNFIKFPALMGEGGGSGFKPKPYNKTETA